MKNNFVLMAFAACLVGSAGNAAVKVKCDSLAGTNALLTQTKTEIRIDSKKLSSRMPGLNKIFREFGLPKIASEAYSNVAMGLTFPLSGCTADEVAGFSVDCENTAPQTLTIKANTGMFEAQEYDEFAYEITSARLRVAKVPKGNYEEVRIRMDLVSKSGNQIEINQNFYFFPIEGGFSARCYLVN